MSPNGDEADPAPAPLVYECPNCGQPVDAIPGPAAALLNCPHCGEHVLIPALDGSTDLPDESDLSEERKESEQSELNALRMRHVIVARRTAIRSRTYNLLGAAGCLMAAVKLVIMGVGEARVVGWHARQVSFMVFPIAMLYFARHFLQRARDWARQSRGAKIVDPETPPDFSTLSDGSQHARNLEDLK